MPGAPTTALKTRIDEPSRSRATVRELIEMTIRHGVRGQPGHVRRDPGARAVRTLRQTDAEPEAARRALCARRGRAARRGLCSRARARAILVDRPAGGCGSASTAATRCAISAWPALAGSGRAAVADAAAGMRADEGRDSAREDASRPHRRVVPGRRRTRMLAWALRGADVRSDHEHRVGRVVRGGGAVDDRRDA